MVEKPPVDEAPSDLAVLGRYVLSPRIFDELEHTQQGAGGEIQLTDAIRALIADQPVYGYEFTGYRHDAGTRIGWLEGQRRDGPRIGPGGRVPRIPPRPRPARLAA